jgi:hypothetical protein
LIFHSLAHRFRGKHVGHVAVLARSADHGACVCLLTASGVGRTSLIARLQMVGPRRILDESF